MSKTYLWSHEPFVSAPPVKRVEYRLFEGKKGEIDEIAVFKLANDKFLFIRFYGTKIDLNKGFTDIEEFNTLQEAKIVYSSMFLEDNDDQKEEKE
jgi:hypothetical protein